MPSLNTAITCRPLDTRPTTDLFFTRPGTLVMRLALCLGAASLLGLSASASVTNVDITLQPVITANLPIFAPDFGYGAHGAASEPTNEAELYTPWDASYSGWWDNAVQELSQARVPVITCDDRGWATYSGTPVPTNGGSFDPRRLTMLTAALTRASATSLFKLSVLVDTAGILAMIEARDGSNYSPNLATKSDWTNVWWTRTINAFFSTVPSSYWFQINGRPAIFLWSVNYFSNHTGNEAPLLQYLENTFISTYGQDPVFVLDQSWFGDSSITNLSSVVADNSWFNGATGWNTATYKGYVCGTTIPGWGLPPSVTLPRNGTNGLGSYGDTLTGGLNGDFNAKANLVYLEGWTDSTEGMGYYRSLYYPMWTYPNLYMNIVHQFSDLRTVTTRLEAEGCDDYFDTTAGNSGGAFLPAGENLDVSTISPYGWAVTYTAATEWIDFTNVPFSMGNYRFSVRYASTASHTLRLYVDGAALTDVVLPSSGSYNTYDTAYLGVKALSHGNHTLKVYWVDGGVNVDWIFAKKFDPMMSFKSALNNEFMSAESGGNNVLVANRTSASTWEHFSVDDLSGSGTVTSGDHIGLQVYDGLYVSAEEGGGGAASPNRRAQSTWETWTVVKVGGSGALAAGNQVALKSSNGVNYLTVESNGSVDVTGTSIGPAQTFTININDTGPQ